MKYYRFHDCLASTFEQTYLQKLNEYFIRIILKEYLYNSE